MRKFTLNKLSNIMKIYAKILLKLMDRKTLIKLILFCCHFNSDNRFNGHEFIDKRLLSRIQTFVLNKFCNQVQLLI